VMIPDTSSMENGPAAAITRGHLTEFRDRHHFRSDVVIAAMESAVPDIG
jgi:hypothetical protein